MNCPSRAVDFSDSIDYFSRWPRWYEGGSKLFNYFCMTFLLVFAFLGIFVHICPTLVPQGVKNRNMFLL